MNRRNFLRAALSIIPAIPFLGSIKIEADEYIKPHPYNDPVVKEFQNRWKPEASSNYTWQTLERERFYFKGEGDTMILTTDGGITFTECEFKVIND